MRQYFNKIILLSVSFITVTPLLMASDLNDAVPSSQKRILTYEVFQELQNKKQKQKHEFKNSADREQHAQFLPEYHLNQYKNWVRTLALVSDDKFISKGTLTEESVEIYLTEIVKAYLKHNGKDENNYEDYIKLTNKFCQNMGLHNQIDVAQEICKYDINQFTPERINFINALLSKDSILLGETSDITCIIHHALPLEKQECFTQKYINLLLRFSKDMDGSDKLNLMKELNTFPMDLLTDQHFDFINTITEVNKSGSNGGYARNKLRLTKLVLNLKPEYLIIEYADLINNICENLYDIEKEYLKAEILSMKPHNQEVFRKLFDYLDPVDLNDFIEYVPFDGRKKFIEYWKDINFTEEDMSDLQNDEEYMQKEGFYDEFTKSMSDYRNFDAARLIDEISKEMKENDRKFFKNYLKMMKNEKTEILKSFLENKSGTFEEFNKIDLNRQKEFIEYFSSRMFSEEEMSDLEKKGTLFQTLHNALFKTEPENFKSEYISLELINDLFEGMNRFNEAELQHTLLSMKPKNQEKFSILFQNKDCINWFKEHITIDKKYNFIKEFSEKVFIKRNEKSDDKENIDIENEFLEFMEPGMSYYAARLLDEVSLGVSHEERMIFKNFLKHMDENERAGLLDLVCDNEIKNEFLSLNFKQRRKVLEVFNNQNISQEEISADKLQDFRINSFLELIKGQKQS